MNSSYGRINKLDRKRAQRAETLRRKAARQAKYSAVI